MDEEQAGDSAGVWGADSSTDKNTFGSPANDADGKFMACNTYCAIWQILMMFTTRWVGKLPRWKHMAAFRGEARVWS